MLGCQIKEVLPSALKNRFSLLSRFVFLSSVSRPFLDVTQWHLRNLTKVPVVWLKRGLEMSHAEFYQVSSLRSSAMKNYSSPRATITRGEYVIQGEWSDEATILLFAFAPRVRCSFSRFSPAHSGYVLFQAPDKLPIQRIHLVMNFSLFPSTF